MSDIFEAPGWWMASDGKWYPPHLHADASYRARWVNVEAAAADDAVAPTTTIHEPSQNGRPVADVAPQNGAFVASEQVAERAAAAARRQRSVQISEPAAVVTEPAIVVESPMLAPEPVIETPPMAPDAVIDVTPPAMPEPLVEPHAAAIQESVVVPATPPIPESAPVQPTPEPAAPPTSVPPAAAASAPVTMPAPTIEPLAAPASPTIEAPHEPPAPEPGFGAPSSTPVSEILGRLGPEALLADADPVQADTPAAAVSVDAESAAAADTATVEVPTIAPEAPADPAEPLAPVRVGPDTSSTASPAFTINGNHAAAAEADVAAPGSRARLEVGNADRGEERFGILTPNQPTEKRIQLQEAVSTSTDLVPVRTADVAVYDDGPTLHDRIVASILFLAGVAMIVGSFLIWTIGPDSSATGWELGDGIATIVGGVLGSAAAGPIFVGFRNIIPKSIAIFSGIVGIVVPGTRGLEALTDAAAAGTGVGAGFWIVFGGAVALVLAGFADQSRFGD